MIMVTVPDDGGFPSVSLGFIGLYGTLAGMSAKGLTGNGRGRRKGEDGRKAGRGRGGFISAHKP